ncbi:FAD/NAD(P)-binding protein [Streptomyces sp. NPDC029041]|uniref:FAD/NAD(P)-binding protein n=1 Tax=Streptomyces sp. NPDC029041 TaxID=3155727 RepID=UPI0033FFE849
MGADPGLESPSRLYGKRISVRRKMVVIGAGATSSSLLMHIARAPGLDCVDLVAPGTAGLGTAFGVTDPALLCNTSVDVTSLKAQGTSDFLDYLAARGHSVGPDDFVPRSLVGQYCRERLSRALRQLRARGVEVRRIAGHATGVTPAPDGHGYRVALRAGDTVTGTDVALCLGADELVLPAALRPFDGHPRLVDSPYPTERLRRLPGDARVLVLGSKLSAIDTALILCRERGRRITLASPSAVLPAVRTRLRRMPVTRLSEADWNSLDPQDPALDTRIARLLLKAVHGGAAPGAAPRARVTGLAEELLRLETRLARDRTIPWQDVIAELIDGLNTHVRDWDPEQRDALLLRCKRLISRYISAIPLSNAQRLLSFLDRGQLTVAPWTPEEIRPAADGWQVRLPEGRVERFSHVVAATGFRAPRLSVTDGGLRIGSGDGPAPDIGNDLRLRLVASGPAERIWALGACAGSRYPIVNYLRASAQHAATVAAQLSPPLTAGSGRTSS